MVIMLCSLGEANKCILTSEKFHEQKVYLSINEIKLMYACRAFQESVNWTKDASLMRGGGYTSRCGCKVSMNAIKS